LRKWANPFAVRLWGTDAAGPVGKDANVVLDSYDGPTPTVLAVDSFARALTVRAVGPVRSRCTTGTAPQTFDFATSHPNGVSHVKRIEAVFSLAGNDYNGAGGPDNGAMGCHFAYFPENGAIYLAGPNGELWAGGNTVVGSQGVDLTNGFCTIHAAETPAPTTDPYINPFILESKLVIEFPPSDSSSKKKHIYTFALDDVTPPSEARWKYWGWWATQ
jgi:hypothetical protein